jgi:hypothetical protein
MTYARGGEYDGEWKKGKREGAGRMKYSDGTEYDGLWKDDLELTPMDRAFPGSGGAPLAPSTPSAMALAGANANPAASLGVVGWPNSKRPVIPCDYPTKRRASPSATPDSEEEDLDEAAIMQQRRNEVKKRLYRLRTKKKAGPGPSGPGPIPASGSSSPPTATTTTTALPPKQTATLGLVTPPSASVSPGQSPLGQSQSQLQPQSRSHSQSMGSLPSGTSSTAGSLVGGRAHASTSGSGSLGGSGLPPASTSSATSGKGSSSRRASVVASPRGSAGPASTVSPENLSEKSGSTVSVSPTNGGSSDRKAKRRYPPFIDPKLFKQKSNSELAS